MSELYTRLHGTTTDSFKIGFNNERVIVSGQTVNNLSATLVDRNSQQPALKSTAFFTANVIAKGVTGVASFELKGSYIQGTTVAGGYVVTTFLNNANFSEPIVTFTAQGIMNLICIGKQGDTIAWTALVDIVSI
jgi:hypothetical protein